MKETEMKMKREKEKRRWEASKDGAREVLKEMPSIVSGAWLWFDQLPY